MMGYFPLLETRNRFANDAQRGRARGAAACLRRHGSGRETWVEDDDNDDGGAGMDFCGDTGGGGRSGEALKR